LNSLVEGMVNWVGYSLIEAERLKIAVKFFQLNTQLFPESSNAWDSIEAERLKIAVKFFQLNTQLFPESSNAWDSLGEGYMKTGKDKKAIAGYQKSLELDPDNKNAKEMIAKIRGDTGDVD
jgi:tetratricopeptide (TPR) repeat protein